MRSDHADVGWNSTVYGNTTSEMRESASLMVKLINAPENPILLSVSTSDSKEAIAKPEFLVLTSSNWNRGVVVTITGQQDNALDGDKPFSVSIAVMVTQDLDYLNLQPVLYNYINRADPSSLLKVITVNQPNCITSEHGQEASFDLRATSWWSGATMPFHSLQVTAYSTRELEGKMTVSTVEFTTAHWNETQRITVSADTTLPAHHSHTPPLTHAHHSRPSAGAWHGRQRGGRGGALRAALSRCAHAVRERRQPGGRAH